MNISQSKQKLSALSFLQLPQSISQLSLSTRALKTPSSLFCRKPVGNLSKHSGTPNRAWHSGHWNIPCCWVFRACFAKQSRQNVCRHCMVLGSVKVPKQIGHLRYFSKFPNSDSIANAKLAGNVTQTLIPFPAGWESMKATDHETRGFVCFVFFFFHIDDRCLTNCVTNGRNPEKNSGRNFLHRHICRLSE